MSSERRWFRKRDPLPARADAAQSAAWLIRLLAVANGIRALWRAAGIISGAGAGGERVDSMIGLTDLSQVVTAIGSGDRHVSVGDLPWYARVLSVTPELLHAAMLLVAAFLMIAVLREMAQGRSFGGKVRRDLAAVSIVLIVGSGLFVVINAIAAQVLTVSINQLDVQWQALEIESLDIPVFLVALGLLASAFVYAFRDGAALERDAEGVI